MSKQNPNQDYYKIGGRDQSDGPDRGDSAESQKQRLADTDKNAKHPAVMRSKKK